MPTPEEEEQLAVALMAEYLAGPGFDGWLAWVDQQSRQMRDRCPDCGHPHELPEVDAAIVRANLEWFIAAGRGA
jgi:hypothetical protein